MTTRFSSSNEIDLDRLQTVLLASKIQTTNNPLYQVITQLIGTVRQLRNNSNTSITNITNAITGFTPGAIIFASPIGNLAEDVANFFWDDTNNRLGIRTNTPTYPVDLITNALI